MDVVTVEHLSKSFGDVQVLSDISFSVHQGEVLAIIGPSGSGKSTLLRAITHLETASSGTIAICGTRILDGGVYADPATLRSALLKLGLVFQDFNLFPHFSVLRNVTEAQVRVLGRGKDEARSVALALLEKMGLAGKAAAYPVRALRRAEAARLDRARPRAEPAGPLLRRADERARPRAHRRDPEGHPRARRREDDDGRRHARDGLRARGRRPRHADGRRARRGGGPRARAHRQPPERADPRVPEAVLAVDLQSGSRARLARPPLNPCPWRRTWAPG